MIYKKALDLFLSQFKGWRTQEVLWLLFCLSSIVALSLYWNDSALAIIASVTGMLYTILAGKGKVSCFIFGLINAPIYAYFAFDARYYGDASLNIFYFLMMFPGLFTWLKNQSNDNEEGIKRGKLSFKERIITITICLVAIVIVWRILTMLNGVRPLCDSITNVLSIAAMVLTIRRAIEEWILWIIVNAVEVFMWYSLWIKGEGSLSILLMWLLFLINGIYLFSLWLRISKKPHPSP